MGFTLESAPQPKPARVHSQITLLQPFGPLVPPSESRSTLVVSHHFGGLLRARSASLFHPASGRGSSTRAPTTRTEVLVMYGV